MLYLSVIVLLFLLCYHFDYKKNKLYRKGWYIFILVVFILIAGLRYRIGVDTVRYEELFDYFPDLSEFFTFDFESTRFAPGYLFINAIVKSIIPNFVAMQFTVAIFVNVTLFYFIYHNTKNIFFALLLYFICQYFNYNFEILRESCAISMFLIGWPYFVKKKYWKYYVCVLFATLFHTSALVTIFLPLLRNRILLPLFTISYRTIFVIIGVLAISIVVSSVFFDWIRLIQFSQIENYADIYENTVYAEGRDLNIIGLLVRTINIIIYPLGAGLLLKSSHIHLPAFQRNPKYLSALGIMLLCYIFFSIASTQIRIFYRFTNYFYPFLFIVLSTVNYKDIYINLQRYRLGFGVWCMLMLPYFALNIYGNFESLGDSGISKIHRYYPYESILDPKMDPTREQLFKYEGI